MIVDELKYKILEQFGFPPTPEQANALDVFARFMTDRNPHAVMILRGSAGTGKTSLSGAIVRTMKAIGQKVMLLAPTGRAAKVFSLSSGSPAFTIHRRIYREKAFSGVDGQFNLNDNLYTDTLFMVDEASMISNLGLGGTTFGSGCLLDDLVHFVYQGHNDRLMLIGDKAQLPPIGEEESPALHAAMLEGYGLSVYECDLNEVLRQSEQSGILYNATMIRQMITHDDITQLPKIHFSGFSDIQQMPGAELIEALANSYHHVGLDDTIVVTRSNKRANIFNQGIRNMVLDRDEELSQGDILMIVKNNYYWMEEERKKVSEELPVSYDIQFIFYFNLSICSWVRPEYFMIRLMSTPSASIVLAISRLLSFLPFFIPNSIPSASPSCLPSCFAVSMEFLISLYAFLLASYSRIS